MCTFLSELPKHSKTIEQPKQQMLYLPLQPSNEKEYYRFRLLWFKSPSKNDRDYPFIERYMHMHFAKDEEDKWQIESQVVCPVTPHVKQHWEGDAYNSCPICNFSNHNFIAFKESGWKDRESSKKQKEFSRKFEACVPVYVVSDPNYDGNQGKFKVIKFVDKEDYKKFKDLVSKASHENLVFNGKNAVDFYIRMETVTETLRKGQPTEYVWKHNVIAKMGFTNKPYDIPAITKEAIDNFEFDDQFYVSSSKEELKEFYDTYCRKMNNDDIPEDEDIKIFKPKNPANDSVKKTNQVESSEKFANGTSKKNVTPPDDDIDGLADFGSSGTSPKKETPAEKPKDETSDVGFENNLPFDDGSDSESEKSDSSDVNLDDIDSLLDDI